MQNDFRLESIPFFSSLNPTQLERVRATLATEHYRAGEDIFVQGAPADGMVMLISGQAVLFRTDADGSQTPLATISANQSLNQEALFAEALQSATMRAAQPVTLLKLTRLAFSQLLVEHPDLRLAFGLADAGETEPPINPRFAEQREDEEILIQTHRHWWSFLRTAWLPLFLMPAMWVGAFIAEIQMLSLGLLALSLILPGLALVYFYLEWRNDSVIVTDQRIIRINRTILAMYRQITQVGLESVQEINFDIPAYDPFARLFRYGTVIVKTAGAQGNLDLDFMPRPEQFQKLIIEDRQYFEQRQAQRHHKMVRAEMQSWIDGDASEADELFASASSDEPPTPVRGTNGYLSNRIKMSNGDIVYRKHASVWAQHTAIPLAIILVSLTVLLLTFTVVSADLRIVTFPVGMVGLLVGCLGYYWMDWDWRNDLYIISDDTITLVHKRPFFLQNLRDQILVERIDNVESISSGFFAAMMNYGDVRMSLVGADEPKMFHRVSKPQQVQQEISRRQHNKAQRRARYDAMQQRQILGEYLGTVNGGNLPGNPTGLPHNQSAAAIASSAAQQGGVANDGAIRPASNQDRNRPPRLPRKLQAPAKRSATPDSSVVDGEGSRRPQRFRTDQDEA